MLNNAQLSTQTLGKWALSVIRAKQWTGGGTIAIHRIDTRHNWDRSESLRDSIKSSRNPRDIGICQTGKVFHDQAVDKDIALPNMAKKKPPCIKIKERFMGKWDISLLP